MAKSHERSETPDGVDALRREVGDLKERIQVLTDVLDEVRDELQWLARNGLPPTDDRPDRFVVKQMAADPCARDWGERLVIVRGDDRDQSPAPTGGKADQSPSSMPSTQGQLF